MDDPTQTQLAIRAEIKNLADSVIENCVGLVRTITNNQAQYVEKNLSSAKGEDVAQLFIFLGEEIVETLRKLKHE